MTTQRGTRLVAAGALLLALTLAVSAAVGAPAPATGHDNSSGDGNASDVPRTVIGVQGTNSYQSNGYVELVTGRESTWRHGAADAYFEVTRLGSGNVLAAWMSHGATRCGPYDPPCGRTGFVVLDPDAPNGSAVVERYGFPVRSHTNSEVHSVDPLPGGGYVFTDMDAERIAIYRDGGIVWEWRASSFYEAPPDPTRRDWLHINDVDYLGDDRFLVSVRNANQVLVIERQASGGRVVEVINADRSDANDETCLAGERLYDANGDGDVRCGDPAVLSRQHNPQWLGDGAVLVADSHNDRVVELHREGGRWTPAWVLTGANGRAFNWPRDADRLPNGHTLITDSRGRRVVEVTENGTTVWSYSTGGGIVYEADRLPYGEPVGGPEYGTRNEGTVTPQTDHDSGEVPVLSRGAYMLRAAFPGLPLWFREPQLALTLVSLGLVLAGIADRLRARR